MVLFSLEFVKLNALGWRSCRPSQRASTPVPVFSDRIGLANRRSFIVGVISPLHSKPRGRAPLPLYRRLLWIFKIRRMAAIVFQFRVVAGAP
jgi:hypothetical protein